MKRKILALLLTLALVLSIAPMAAYAEEDIAAPEGDGNPVVTTIEDDDDNAPATTIEGDDDNANLTTIENDDDNANLTTIDDETDCNHFGDQYVEKDANGHTIYCSLCDHVFVSEAHSDNDGDGRCEVCSYCFHLSTTYYGHDNAEFVGHIERCDLCGYEVSRGEHYGNVDDGKCDACGIYIGLPNHTTHTVGNDCKCTVCGQVFHAPTIWERDENQHTGTCSLCKKVVTSTASHTGMEDNVCDICGYGCQHENTYYYYTARGHEKRCKDCRDILEAWTAHEGSCDICGFEPCPDGKHSFGTEGSYKHLCYNCDFTTECEDKNGDCLCDICGEDFHRGEMEWDESQHWLRCDACGEKIYRQNHAINENGVCEQCGFGCKHANAVFSKNQHGHIKQCPDCYQVLVAWATHEAPCDICGYKPCADGKHTFGTSGRDKHICQDCSYVSACEDNNGDCVCDVCGYEAHVLLDDQIYWNETQHWYICKECDNKVYVSSHYDSDKDGKCDACNCSMSNPGSGSGKPSTDPEKPIDPEKPTEPKPEKPSNNKGLDNVPKTGDVAVTVLASLMGVGAAVVPFRKRFR